MAQTGDGLATDNDPPDYGGFLRRVLLFRDAPDHVVAAVAASMTPMTVTADEVVCREGEVGDRFYLIQSGSLIATTTIAGQEHELGRLFPGEFLGEIALLGETERTATVRALEETRLLTLDSGQFGRLMADVPGLAGAVETAARRRSSRSLRTALEVGHRNLAALLQSQDEVSIGRADDNDLIFDSPNVGAHHARIRKANGQVELLDLGSGADLFVNGRPVRGSATLTDGAQVVIGDQRFLFDHSKPLTVIEPRGIRIDLADVRVELKSGKTLLQDVSFSILPGEFVGIVGGSGAGKTTLLDAMAGLRPATSGTVLYNGRDYYRDIEEYRHLLGYVPQDDIIHGDMSVRRTLHYAARLRLPRGTDRSTIERSVDERLEELGLSQRADVAVDKLSGGQRKRASIAIELLTEPRVFYLDEPTSGLDASNDRSMMKLLRELADGGRTVVLTTHATKNVKMCDKVVVLAPDGHLAFVGPPADALEYLDVEDFDEVYDRLEESPPDVWSASFRASRAHHDVEASLASADGHGTSAAASAHAPPERRRGGLRQFLHQLRVLSSRNFVLHAGRPQNIMPLVMQPVVISLLIMALFKSDIWESTTTNPTAALQLVYTFAFVMFLFGLLFGAQETVTERSIFRRESTVGVRVLPYLLSKTTFLAPLLVLTAGAMTTLFWLTGRLPDRGPDVYVPLIVTMILTGWAGMAMSLLISSVVRTSQQATDLLTPWIAPQVLFAGALFAVPAMNLVGRALSNITAVRWSFEAASEITEMKELFDVTRSPIGQALLIEYEDSFNWEPITYWIILAAFILAPLMLTMIVLSRKVRQA